jgi:hypothetical protein
MNESINVRTIQTLGNLKNAFITFLADTQESFIAIENELRRTLDWLKGEVDVRQRHVMRCRDEVDFAERALRTCKAQADDDYTPDCRAEIYELQEARRSLRHAEDELKIARLWFSKIQKAIQQFGTHVRRLKGLATDRTESVKAFLDRATSDLERYLGISPPTTAVAGLPVEAFPAGATPSVITAWEVEAPAEATSKASGQWVERGVVMVDVAVLPMPEDISNALDFQKIPVDEMKAGLKMLQEMLPIIESGVGASNEYWTKRDNELGLDYPNGYLRIYEAFYGHDAIRVEKSGNNYDIVNGRHRVWLAKQIGIGRLPVSLVELESKPSP